LPAAGNCSFEADNNGLHSLLPSFFQDISQLEKPALLIVMDLMAGLQRYSQGLERFPLHVVTRGLQDWQQGTFSEQYELLLHDMGVGEGIDEVGAAEDEDEGRSDAWAQAQLDWQDAFDEAEAHGGDEYEVE
jgi:hypothetical protein